MNCPRCGAFIAGQAERHKPDCVYAMTSPPSTSLVPVLTNMTRYMLDDFVEVMDELVFEGNGTVSEEVFRRYISLREAMGKASRQELRELLQRKHPDLLKD